MDEWNVLDHFLDYPLTDIGSSKLYADYFKGLLLYISDVGCYYYYDSKKWVRDHEGLYAKRLAKKFAHDMIEKANSLADDEMRKAYTSYYNKFNSFNVREKLVKDAKSVHITEFRDFNNKPYLYNCINGTFNIETGKLQMHKSSDMLTQISNVTYDSAARCDRWERYIDEIMNSDKQSMRLLQTIAGYCLSGHINHECFFMLYGSTTRNGKGTFNSTMMKMHGDYGEVLQPEALANSKFTKTGESANESIANLAGVRYVSVSEPGKGLVLNSDLVKTMTGGDPIQARRLHEHFFKYLPDFKIVVNTNYLPVVLDQTIFDSDRLVIVLFDKHFSMEIRDSTLKGTFIKEDSLSGIFNWCYEGYKILSQDKVFKMPDKSKKILNQYRDDSKDVMQEFIAECLVASDGARTTVKTAYEEYKDWSKENGFSTCSKKTFKKELVLKKIKVESYIGQDCIFDFDIAKVPFLN